MRASPWAIVIGVVVLLVGGVSLKAADDKKDDKGEVVTIDELKAAVPTTWKKEKPKNNFRQFQFKLAKAEGDKEDAELFVSDQVIGKNDEVIFKRWKQQFFIPPEGKSIDDVAKTDKVKVGKFTASYLDLYGTYLDKAKPIDPDSKAIKRPNYRMIRVIVRTPGEASYISLTGPAKTVEQHKKAFDDWVKSFK